VDKLFKAGTTCSQLPVNKTRELGQIKDQTTIQILVGLHARIPLAKLRNFKAKGKYISGRTQAHRHMRAYKTLQFA